MGRLDTASEVGSQKSASFKQGQYLEESRIPGSLDSAVQPQSILCYQLKHAHQTGNAPEVHMLHLYQHIGVAMDDVVTTYLLPQTSLWHCIRVCGVHPATAYGVEPLCSPVARLSPLGPRPYPDGPSGCFRGLP